MNKATTTTTEQAKMGNITLEEMAASARIAWEERVERSGVDSETAALAVMAYSSSRILAGGDEAMMKVRKATGGGFFS